MRLNVKLLIIMLLGQKTIKLPLRHSETLSAPALDLFQKRVF